MNTNLCSDEPIRSRVGRALHNQWFMAVVLLIAAMAIRWGFHLYDPHMTGFAIYHGSPLSDGYSYTYKAINIANGYGIPPEQQPAIRPFYSIVLACLYTWTGFSLLGVTVLNVVIGGITAALIYLCGRQVFDPLYALAAALFFAIDPTQLIQTPQPLTEPLGLLFFVGSVYGALLAFKNGQAAMFFVSGLLIALSNLTRTLTVLTLPFYVGLVLIVGWRDRMLKAAGLRALFMLVGFFCVMLPWLIRQERLYGIASISDNVGEAIYAATSPGYRQWTPLVRKDADAAGIPNTIGDRYRYFINQAVGNVKAQPGFYLRNFGNALWEFANTFGSRSRIAGRYIERFSRAANGQDVLLIYLLIFTIAIWLLCKGSPFNVSNLVFLMSSMGLIVFYRILPAWATFCPICVGLICAWQTARPVPVLVLFGSLVTTVLGSVIFANPTLFRTILMTDWLFLFFFLAAIWSPAEIAVRKLARSEPVSFAGEEEIESPFQKALSLLSVRVLVVFLSFLLLFFAISSARIIARTISVSKNGKVNRVRYVPPWIMRQAQVKLSVPEKQSVLRRLQHPPCSVLSENDQQLSIYGGGKDIPSAGTYVVEIDGFYYDYYIPPGDSLWHPQLGPKPYPRTLARLSRFDFVIPGEVPSDFSGRPLLLVGMVVPEEAMTTDQTNRMWVKGLAIIPIDNESRPDFAHAFCAPAISQLKP
jgi:Dolichyl-phosphate-mannose-protein mannosyltransferase